LFLSTFTDFLSIMKTVGLLSCVYSGSAAEEQQSMLQTRHALGAGTLQELYVAGGDRAKTSAMLETMAADSIKSGVSADDSTKEMLSTIEGMMRTIQTDDLTANQQKDQDDIDALISGFDATAATFTTEQAADAVTHDALIEGFRVSHATCRGEHKVGDDDRVTHCKALADFIAGVNQAECVVPTRAGNKDGKFFSALRSYADTYQAAWDIKESTCAAAEEESWVTKSTSCNGLQSSFEMQTCEYRSQIHNTCSTYGTTYDTKKVAFDGDLAAAEARSDGRAVEWKAIGKILCYISVIKSDETTEVRTAQLASCKGSDADAGTFVITAPQVPAKKLCSFEKVEPYSCTDAFKEKHYKDLYMCYSSAFYRCQAHTCAACTSLPTSTSYTVKVGTATAPPPPPPSDGFGGVGTTCAERCASTGKTCNEQAMAAAWTDRTCGFIRTQLEAQGRTLSSTACRKCGPSDASIPYCATGAIQYGEGANDNTGYYGTRGSYGCNFQLSDKRVTPLCACD